MHFLEVSIKKKFVQCTQTRKHYNWEFNCIGKKALGGREKHGKSSNNSPNPFRHASRLSSYMQWPNFFFPTQPTISYLIFEHKSELPSIVRPTVGIHFQTCNLWLFESSFLCQWTRITYNADCLMGTFWYRERIA